MKVKVVRNSIIVPGFCFAGVACGLKPSGKKDLALIVSDVPATAVAAFTTNALKAAPVLVGQEQIKRGKVQAVVVNSGNANASTAQVGIDLAHKTCALVGHILGIPEALVFPSSTGKIGVLPSWEKMRSGIQSACTRLKPRGFWEALSGIMTTDAFPKAAVRYISIDGKPVTIAGMAKGAGMINPNMATMLAYVVTDARISHQALQQVIHNCLSESFNAISVDGDTSTNDTLLIMANGVAKNREVTSQGREFRSFQATVSEVLCDLARLMVKDGEGATRVVDIYVRGAKTPADAEKVARTVAYSPLVKTAFFGGDPNWGRIACAVGYAGVPIKEEKLELRIGDIVIGHEGISTGQENEKRAAVLMQKDEFSVTIDLHLGRGNAHIVTSDLSLGYVRFNSAYST